MAKGDKIYLATKQELQDVAANAGTKIQEITQQAYNALSEENKNKSDVIYRITDADSTAVLISMQLGETSTTAYAGNKGKALADTIGNTDISEVADGTLTGAVLDLATNKTIGVVELTQAQYNALSNTDKQKDVFYRLTDAEDAGVRAVLIGETATSAFAGNRGKTLEDTVNNDCLKGGIITGTLTSGNTSAILTSNKITSNSIIINISCSKSGLSPSSVNIETGRITLTFSAAQNEDVAIKVIIINGGE